MTLLSDGMDLTVTVTETIRLVKPGVLVGEVHTPCLAIEEGACFQGRSDMGRVPRQEPGTGREQGNGSGVEVGPVEDRQPEVQLVGGSP
ncbi:MAG: polymer-forming cytoskeletal protein [Nitrospirota bacterium]